MFPTDAITIRQSITGTGSVVLASSTRTILVISQQKENASKNLSVNCNSDIITSLYSTINMFEQNMQYRCNGTVTLSTNGSGSGISSFTITYVNRDISSMPQTENFLNGFSYGDIIIILILLLTFTLKFFDTIKVWIFGIKTDGITRIKNYKT